MAAARGGHFARVAACCRREHYFNSVEVRRLYLTVKSSGGEFLWGHS